MPRFKTLSELFAVERRAQQMSLDREVLPDRSEVREKRVGALWVTKAAQARLTFKRRLMAIFGPIVHAGCRLDVHVPDVCQLGNPGLRGRITAQLVGDDLAWYRARTKHALKNRSVAAVSRRFCSRISSSAPFSPTARH